MRPSKSDLIELLAGILVDVATPPAGYHSEAVLATALGTDPRHLRALRTAGIVGPRRLGRGFVYTTQDARVSAVAVSLMRLGCGTAEIATLLGEADRCAFCHDRGGPCRPRDCCAALLDEVARRTEAEIAALRRFDQLLDHYADRRPGPFPTA